MTERLPFHFSLSCIGEGNGNPLQCSCLENPKDRGTWWASISGVAQIRTRLKRLSSSSSSSIEPIQRISSRFFSLRTSTLICFQFWKFLHQRNGLKWGVFSYIFKSLFVGVNKFNKLIVQFSHSVMSDSVTSWTAARQASLSTPTPGAYLNSCPLSQWCHSIISSSVIPFSSRLQSFPASGSFLCHPLLLPPSIFPSIRVFSSESVLRIRWPQYWSFSFNISLSNEYSGLISFRMEWLDLLAVQEILKSLLQHHSSKASILRHSAFFIVQLSQWYMTTGKTIALTRWTFVGKVMSLLFNMLSSLDWS